MFTGRSGVDWRDQALIDIEEVLSDPSFPCLFGRRAWKNKSSLLLFCSGLKAGGLSHFERGVLEYTAFVKSTPVKDRLFVPLLAFIDEPIDTDHRSGHHIAAWQLLQNLLDSDTAPWPTQVPKDPNNSLWSFCFNGIQLLFNISTPAHTQLRSRRLGRLLTFVVNPRENFDLVASAKDRSGLLVRQKIRDRVSDYNGGGVPEDLGFFGARDNFEWKQFQLGEQDLPRPSTCPLRPTKNKAPTVSCPTST